MSRNDELARHDFCPYYRCGSWYAFYHPLEVDSYLAREYLGSQKTDDASYSYAHLFHRHRKRSCFAVWWNNQTDMIYSMSLSLVAAYGYYLSAMTVPRVHFDQLTFGHAGIHSSHDDLFLIFHLKISMYKNWLKNSDCLPFVGLARSCALWKEDCQLQQCESVAVGQIASGWLIWSMLMSRSTRKQTSNASAHHQKIPTYPPCAFELSQPPFQRVLHQRYLSYMVSDMLYRLLSDLWLTCGGARWERHWPI